MILMVSKSASNFDQESKVPLSKVTANKDTNNFKQGIMAKHSPNGNGMLTDVSQVPNTPEAAADGNQENDSDNEDDELKRKIEEFINKVNEGWKAEFVRTEPLG